MNRILSWIWTNMLKILGIIFMICLIIAIIAGIRTLTKRARVIEPVVQEPVAEEPEVEVQEPVAEEPEVEVQEPVAEKVLQHTAYWTVSTPKENWPDIKEMDFVTCHGDPDSEGKAKVFFLTPETSDELPGLECFYYNGYIGELNTESKTQVIMEIEESVRPHVPGFTLYEYSLKP